MVKKVAILNYELDLPTSMKVRIKVFYISLLKPALKKVPLEKKLEVEAEEEKEFKIEEVLDL